MSLEKKWRTGKKMGMGICDDCTKALTDKCPRKECWENGYSAFELEEDKE